MKLIATLGATPVNKEHIYIIDNKTYSAEISPLALKKHFNIKNEYVYIIGTKKTKEVLGNLIASFNFIEINENSLENVFETAVKYLEKDDIVDLTQGFRSIPFGMFLALNFSKVMNKEPYDIYYAQMQKSDCNYREEICTHNFISLKKYLEIGDLAREIGGFVSSWYVLDYEIDNFKNISGSLNLLSKKLLSNDLDVLNEIQTIENEIENIREDFKFLEKHFMLLDKEINKIKEALLRNKDYVKLYEMTKLYFEKKLMLQTLTMLFEAMSAYVASIVPDDFYCIKNGKKYFKNSANRYSFRNCVKNRLRQNGACEKWFFKNLKNCIEFRDKFRKIDEIRNDSAHAFINGKKLQNYHNEIEEIIKFFGKYVK